MVGGCLFRDVFRDFSEKVPIKNNNFRTYIYIHIHTS